MDIVLLGFQLELDVFMDIGFPFYYNYLDCFGPLLHIRRVNGARWKKTDYFEDCVKKAADQLVE